MKENAISEMYVYKAEIQYNSEFFFCDHFQEVGEKNDYTCGAKYCKFYNPRNKKNGRCKHYKNTYEPAEKVLLKLKNNQ